MTYQTKQKTMELTKNHRAALIEQLLKSKEDEIRIGRLIHNSVSDEANEDRALTQGFEIEKYLAQQETEAIKNALIENEIDY